MAAIITPETATDAPHGPDPDSDSTSGPNSRAEALWAALTATPGGTAIMIGAVAGMSRAAASKILNQLEAEGRATRVPGGHDGRGRTPDRWHPVIADTPAPAPRDDAPADPAQDASTEPDPAAPITPAGNDEPDLAPEPTGEAEATGEPDADRPGPAEVSEAEPVASSGDTEHEPTPEPTAAPVPGDVTSADPAQDTSAEPVAPPGDDEPDLASEPTGEAEATGEPGPADDGPDVPEEDGSDIAEEESAQPEDPAHAQARAELLELADLILGTVTAMDTGEPILALGRLEMFTAKTAQAHRTARAVLTGTSPARTATGRTNGRNGAEGAVVRPGQLRDRILAHLAAHPGKDFTPYEIGRVLESSSGAVANALDRLVNLGQAELTCERPRRFALTADPAPGN
ncbi:hypothetical protein [Planomonospora parontospora]|uniref:hypothetical protein n=1 Tax=Planomonospora parontospora TaxID=58119 RepID=UPI00166F87D2|nr:hypothetical protein [Planomonospora parontospora]GGL42472.1 hypothetical protein GCM10014719_49760 [Planomonospora parontospora subsp. antibiotica]GII18385.1 hypothetical protein Ppa05_51110 [Planomonospora parontospora subsp. antibiotica]